MFDPDGFLVSFDVEMSLPSVSSIGSSASCVSSNPRSLLNCAVFCVGSDPMSDMFMLSSSVVGTFPVGSGLGGILVNADVCSTCSVVVSVAWLLPMLMKIDGVAGISIIPGVMA